MLTKEFWQSKIFWLNLITFLVMVLDLLVQQTFIPPEWLPYIASIVGILNVILRVWFTDTGIASQRAQAAKVAALKK